jgi:hypothetical protein
MKMGIQPIETVKKLSFYKKALDLSPFAPNLSGFSRLQTIIFSPKSCLDFAD